MKGLCLRLVITLCLIPNALAASTQRDDPLLEQSYRLSQTLGGRERVFYLIELCRLSAQPQIASEKAQERCLKLFDVASAESDVRTRIAGQKNALMFLSYVNPALSVKLVPKIEVQRPGPGQMLWEDFRSDLMETQFQNFLTILKPKDYSEIIAQARYVGQTGQYPYRALAAIIGDLSGTHKNDANTMLSDAVTFYARETGYYNRDEEFLSLLRSLKNSDVDNGIAAQAVSMFVQHLQSDPIHLPGDYYGEIHLSDGKVFPFTDRNAAFLMEAFPAIRRFRSDLAARLGEHDARLTEAADNMSYISGGFVQGDPTSAQARQQHFQWLQQSLLNRIKECQDSNPQLTAQLAQRLTDLSSRIAGFSAAVPGIARNNPAEAHRIYEKQLSEFSNVGETVGRLRAMVALAKAAYHLADYQQYQSLAMQTLDMGVRFFNSDDKSTRAQNRKGFDELQDVVTFSASQPVDILKSGVQALPDDWLKAYLWLYVVEGHAKRNAPPESPKPCPE
jgi:hypothetical protein